MLHLRSSAREHRKFYVQRHSLSASYGRDKRYINSEKAVKMILCKRPNHALANLSTIAVNTFSDTGPRMPLAAHDHSL
jgi:S-adenosylmethionine/arginine decarboxylase-like enzyme